MIARRFSDLLVRLRGGGRDSERARLAAILELNRGLALVQDRRHLLARVLDEAIDLFGAERGFVVTSDAGVHRVEIGRSLDREPVRNGARKISTTIVQSCLARRAGVFCEDAQDGDFGAAQSVADLALRSVLCMPLIVGDVVFGVLYLDHRFRSGAFAAADLPWLQAFADQAAITLHVHQTIADNQARSRALEATVAAQARELSEVHGVVGRAQLRHDYAAIVGESPALLRCLAIVDRITDGDYPVLVSGESGTGKELIARAIHANGPRCAAPFVAVNLAAVAASLLESELFGHVRGAFTGAERARAGLLREADRGVLFLDEITEMAPELQAKLLRFLDDPLVRPVGGDREGRVDVRIVAATNRSPAAAVAEGRLRADLFYRLAVVPIELPPLRERSTDVPLLVSHFLGEAARARGGPAKRLTAACLQALAARRWSGNVRELRNELLRLDALGDGDELGEELLRAPAGAPSPVSLNLAELERRAIEQALREVGGNKAAAARRLGISRRTLYNKLRAGE